MGLSWGSLQTILFYIPPTEHSLVSQRLPFQARRSTTLNKMNTPGGFLILAACLAVTMAVPVQDRAVQAVTGGVNQFSSVFFKEVASSNPGNLITSPLSASVALSMAAYGSRGETEKEFKQVLHIPEESVARTGYANLIDSINSITDVVIHLANKMFVNENFEIKKTFKTFTETAFRSASQNINFGNTQAAANTINTWVEDHTNNRIKDLIKPDKLSGDTAMVLVNAVYFKGNWAHKFESKLTENKPFHVTKSHVKNVPTMHRLGTYRYGVLPEMHAKFLEIPYKGEEMSMIILLPDAVDGLAELERKLATKDLSELVKSGYKTEVSLSLPKFKIESTLDLGEHLKNLGLQKAFDQFAANFSGISDTGVYISSVVQKAFIEVNEEGSEAAAATAITAVFASALYEPPPPPVFNVDRPFYYNIIKLKPVDEGDKLWGSYKPIEVEATLFAGHIYDPSARLVIHALSLTIPEEFDVNRPFYYSVGWKAPVSQNGQDRIIPLFCGHVVDPQ